MGSNAQATTKGAIILLTNFVFISVIFPFVVLAFLDFSSLRTHFWPFTQVLRKNWPRVTRKVARRGNFEAHAVASNSRMARRGAVSELPASRSRKRQLGPNSLTARLALPCREVSSVHDMPPEQLPYCFRATPLPTSRPSAAPNCNSLPPSTMTKARV